MTTKGSKMINEIHNFDHDSKDFTESKIVDNSIRYLLAASSQDVRDSMNSLVIKFSFTLNQWILISRNFVLESPLIKKLRLESNQIAKSERGDVPGWVLVVLMTTGLVTGIWTVAQPRLSSILKNSLDNMNSIR
jgi:hypothetical protein